MFSTKNLATIIIFVSYFRDDLFSFAFKWTNSCISFSLTFRPSHILTASPNCFSFSPFKLGFSSYCNLNTSFFSLPLAISSHHFHAPFIDKPNLFYRPSFFVAVSLILSNIFLHPTYYNIIATSAKKFLDISNLFVRNFLNIRMLYLTAFG